MNRTQSAGQELLSLPIDEILADLQQPRKSLLKEELERMVASIHARGILQPLRVRWDEQRDHFVIVCGESRWRAAKLAGLERVPCLVITHELTEIDVLEEQITENVVRNQLHALELSRALAKLKALKQCNSQQLAATLGISGQAVTRAEALLSLSEEIQQLVDSGKICESAAYEISRHPDPAAQRELAMAVAAGKLNRDQTADAVRAAVGKRMVKPKAARLPLRLDGISVTVSADQPLSWDTFNAALERIRKVARKLCDNGEDITELARSLRAS